MLSPAKKATCRTFLCALAFVSVADAQVVEKGRTFDDLTASHPCASGLTGRIARVTDCDAADDVGDGAGAFNCWVSCDGSAPWVTQAIGAGGGYVLLAGDEDGQTIQGLTGANSAAVLIGIVNAQTIRLRGSGTTPAYVDVTDQEVEIGVTGGGASWLLDASSISLFSPDTLSSLEVTDNGSYLYGGSGVVGVSATSKVTIKSAQTPPTNAGDACDPGETILTATFLYYCVANNTWVRVAMATWP